MRPSLSVRPINATNPQALTGLTPETKYEVQVQSVCGSQNGSSEWTSTSFTTLPSCVAPTDLTITNITTSSALITWSGSANSYNLKVNGVEYNNVTNPYTLRNLTAATLYTVEVQSVCSASNTSSWISETFVTEYCEEADKCLLTFVLGDSYGDGWNNAYIDIIDVTTNMSIANMAALSHGGGSVQSYDTLTLAVCDGSDIKFVWHTGSWDGETSFIVNDVNGDQGVWGVFNVDLSDYAGQTGYVAIRHFNCTDMFRLNVDDINITEPGVENPWITLSTTETTITLSNLQIATNYEYQIQSVCDDIPTAWSATNYFTTMDGLVFITEGDWNNGNNWTGGQVPAEGADVIINANAVIPASYTAIANQITINGGSITIKDGGQLIHPQDVQATLEKQVMGYTANDNGWYTIASPVTDDYSTEGLVTDNYDLYLYHEPTIYWWNAQGDDLHDHSFNTLVNGQGYLYANGSDKTLSFLGVMQGTDNTVTLPELHRRRR